VIHLLWEPELADELVALFHHTMETGEPYIDNERPAKSPDGGETLYFQWQIRRVDLPDGQRGVVAYFLDITRQVRARQELARAGAEIERQQRLHEASLSSITDFVYLFDRQGRFLSVNKALLDLWGLTLKEAVGKTFGELPYEPELANKLMRQIEEVFITGRPVTDETTYINPAGAVGYYQYIFSPVVFDGEVQYVAGCTRVLTKRKRIEEALRTAKEVAEAANRAKEYFIAALSHELRTPLNAMAVWMELLQTAAGDESAAPDPKELREGLEAIDRNLRAEMRLVDDLLDVSRIATGKLSLQRSTCHLRDVINAALDAAHREAAAKQIALKTNLPSDLRPIHCDSMRLQQAIWNLLHNAIKFTPPGQWVRVSVDQDDTHSHIMVSDTGPGLPPGINVFDAFSQGMHRTSPGGLGLGLSIVKSIVELHGGTVEASNGKDGGATFKVTLPNPT
jgi:PAS domain S-box-containing protein